MQNIEYALGVALSICSVALVNVGLLVQVHSARVEAGRPPHRRPRLALAIALNAIAEVGLSPLAVLFAPMALLAPLGGLGMVFNALFAHAGCVCGVKERMGASGWIATLAIVGGVAVVAAAIDGDDRSARWTAVELRRAIGAPDAVAVLVGSVASAGVGCVGARLLRAPTRRASAAAVAAGFLGTCLVVWVKVVANLLARGEVGEAPALFALSVGALVVGAPAQIAVLNVALALHRATIVVPTYMATLTVQMAVVGGVVFDELAQTATWRVLVFACGVAMCIGGVGVLGSFAPTPPPAAIEAVVVVEIAEEAAVADEAAVDVV